MEGSGAGIGRLDCYEDMFKEITRKLYGDDPDHRTSSVQNEFETSVSYKTEDDTDHGTDGSEDGNWTCEDEPFKGTDGSRIAAYHAGKTTWRCYECGDCMGGAPRDVAEHFLELHSSRIIGDDLRNRHHSPRKDYLQNDFKIDEVVSYLERVRDRAERAAPPSRRTQETQTVPAALLPATTTFLLQELPSTPTATPQHLHQNSPAMTAPANPPASVKRYNCPNCPYGTDRRDLFTRHENIHREDKPFHCYVCFKQFNRADHVKKHFIRMHREHTYELSKIRKPPSSSSESNSGGASSAMPKNLQLATTNVAVAITNGNGVQHTTTSYAAGYNKSYQLHTEPTSNGSGSATLYQTPAPIPVNDQPEANGTSGTRRVQNGGGIIKTVKGPKGTLEKRYYCPYCSWSGVDNWCLKRHLNTHLKPFLCSLCEYKAARAERLATHVLKVHNKRQCSRCSFLGEDATQLQVHQLHVHRVNGASTSNRHQQAIHPSGGAGRPPPGPPVFPASSAAIAPATSVIPSTAILGTTQSGRRSRKQSMPRKALIEETWDMEDAFLVYFNEGGRMVSQFPSPRRSDEEIASTDGSYEQISSNDESDDQMASTDESDDQMASTDEWDDQMASNEESDDQLTCSDGSIDLTMPKDFVKSYRYPREPPARSSSKPYQTKASRAVQTTWKNRREQKVTKNSSGNVLNYSLPELLRSEITLKATVITARM